MTNAPVGETGSEPAGPWNWLIATPLGLLALVAVAIIGGWMVNDWVMHDAGSGKKADSSGRIRAGMHISEVGRLLDNGPPPSPSYPRLRDRFPADEFGDGTIDYEGDGVILKIHFANGRVTSVAESRSTAGPGFHRCSLVVEQR
jgi:hypothetical protein